MTLAEIEELYREVVLDHYRAPRNWALLAHPTAKGHALNPVCGDEVTVEVELTGDTVNAISAQSVGCSIAVAAGSVMTELAQGQSARRCRELQAQLEQVLAGSAPSGRVDRRLRAFARVAALPARQRCALLAWEALTEALDSVQV